MRDKVNSQTDSKQKIEQGQKKAGWQRWALPGLGLLLLVLAAGGFWYYLDQQKYVYTDKADIEAPVINLSPRVAGVLKELFVDDGDLVEPFQTVAIVGNETIKSEIAGLVLTVSKNIGTTYSSAIPVVTMIDPEELRVVARIEEDKGLKDVKVGQSVIFTVDAYGSQKFTGTVESISQASRNQDVVFNISDQRQEQEFEVKIKYDRQTNPDFRNGMSAKVWIVK
jgi:multidrug resistance efflux pump